MVQDGGTKLPPILPSETSPTGMKKRRRRWKSLSPPRKCASASFAPRAASLLRLLCSRPCSRLRVFGVEMTLFLPNQTGLNEVARSLLLHRLDKKRLHSRR